MMNKLFSKSKSKTSSSNNNKSEYGAILNDPEAIAAANQLAETGTNVVNDMSGKLQSLTESQGPYSFRVLALVGGIAMILTNALAFLPRFLTLNLTGGIIAVYCVLFGIVIVLLEANNNSNLHQGVRYYARFLETIWGRGLLYFFCGTLQISNWNLFDWIVGGFMMVVGVVAILAGVKVARDLRKIRATMDDERALKAKWKKFDQGGKGYWNLTDMTAFVQDCPGIHMSQNEVVAAYTAINRNLDDQLSYQELLQWWNRAASRDAEYYMERFSV